MLTHLAPARRRLVLALVGLVALVAVGAGSLAVWSAAGDDAVVDQSRQGPVLLVPGYGGSVASLQPLAAALRAGGRDVTVVPLPDRALGDLGQQATALGRAVDSALERTGAPSVDLVGYSAGGVVARLWVVEDGGADRVRRLVTLGSPHHGTDLATLGSVVGGACPAACQQLAPSSPVLARLEAEALPTGPAYLSLWTTGDDVVVPPGSAVLEGVASPSLQSICPSVRVSHSGLPSQPLLQRLVAEALAPTPVPSWGPSDCARLTS